MCDYDKYIEEDHRTDRFFCSKCDYNSTNDDDLIIENDELYCFECHEEKFHHCSACDRLFEFDELEEIDDKFYCEDCKDE